MAARKRTSPTEYVVFIEQLAWGDVAQYLSLPSAGLGGFAIEAVATLDQKERFLSRFADPKGKPAWAQWQSTEPGRWLGYFLDLHNRPLLTPQRRVGF